MASHDAVRVVMFYDGDFWVAQCLEYDIGAQADDIETLTDRFDAVLSAEREESMRRHGEPFAGIPQAPKHYHSMWNSKAYRFTAAKKSDGAEEESGFQLKICA